MANDYASVWVKLPDELRSRLRANPGAELKGEDAAAIADSGLALVGVEFSSEAMPYYELPPEFQRWISEQQRAGH